MAPPALVQALRLPFLTGSLMPIIIVAAWIGLPNGSSWLVFVLTMVGVGLLHSGGNTINDYYDAAGSDPVNQSVTPFSGGSRVVQQGRFSRGNMMTMTLICFGSALACAVALAYLGRPWVLAVGGFALAGTWLYSGTPLALMSHSLGELILFLLFGPVLTWGAGYALTGHFTGQAFILGLPTGWVILAVLWINQFPDLEADRAAGKINLVVRLGTARARWGYAALMLAPYPTLALMVLWGGFTAWLYLGWLTLPLAIKAVRLCWQHHQNLEVLVGAQAMTIMTHMALALTMTVGLIIRLIAGPGA